MLTAARLRELLYYDPETGDFTWIAACPCGTNTGAWRIGQRAGSKKKDSGYVTICIDLIAYRAHRLAWLYMTGEWPPGRIDHEDRNRSHNRWENLRDGRGWKNNANAQINSQNTTGFKGVSKCRKGYVAKVGFEGKRMYLGVFDTAIAAHTAYVAKAKEVFGEFYCAG